MPEATGAPRSLSRAWYGASITDFLCADPAAVVGQIVTNSDFTVLPAQRDAWLAEIRLLRESLLGLDGSLFMEFSIPRMGRRIDAVLLIGPVVFAIEFKTGESRFERSAIDQAWDYALDLKNFHEASHTASIVPVLITSGNELTPAIDMRADDDLVYRPISIDAEHLRKVIDDASATIRGHSIDAKHWAESALSPDTYDY